MNSIIINMMIFFIGSLLIFLGSVGIWRFKDFFMKMQSSTLILIGVLICILSIAINSEAIIKTKTLLVVIIMLITSPVSSHVIAMLGYERCKKR